MKIKTLILVLFSLILFQCQNNKPVDIHDKTDIAINEKNNPIDTLTIDKIFNEVIEIKDSFTIQNMKFITVYLSKKYLINGKKYESGRYLLTLNKTDKKNKYEKINLTNLSIGDAKKDNFYDLTDKFELKEHLIIRQSYHGGGPADMTDHNIILVSKDTIRKLISFTHWDYYYNDLNISKKNDSIFSIQYASRDKFGYFLNDYFIEINTRKLQGKLVIPDIQGSNFQCGLLDSLTVYFTKTEAVNKKADIDSLISYEGENIRIDSFF